MESDHWFTSCDAVRRSPRHAVAGGKARLPPRWFVVTFWHVHRLFVRATGGRRGVRPPRPGKWGTLSAHHEGPAQRRVAERDRRLLRGRTQPGLDGHERLGGGRAAWWLNLQATPEAIVELAGETRREVLGRAAIGEERERLWRRWSELDKNLDDYAARRPQETAVVVLEPPVMAEISPSG